jgi:hypothetical protein
MMDYLGPMHLRNEDYRRRRFENDSTVYSNLQVYNDKSEIKKLYIMKTWRFNLLSNEDMSIWTFEKMFETLSNNLNIAIW